MKSININGLNSTQQARLQQEQVRSKDAEAPMPTTTHSAPDQVSVSSRAEEVNQLVTRVSQLADIRNEQIVVLRQVIQANQYRIPSSRIADAIIRDEAT